MKKQMFALFAFAVFAIALAGAAYALPLSIEKVEVDGTTVQEAQVNRLSLERNDEFTVKVTFTATADADNVVGQAFITGYEHADEEPSDLVGPFTLEGNTTYTKKFLLKLPKDMQEDSYKLRILFTDRNGEELLLNYNLKIDEPRHSVDIQDVILYPEKSVTAGSALLTTVRVKNYGQKDENDVKVTLEIPGLGLSATDYLDSVDSNDEQETEELYLRIPREAKAGDYEMLVTVHYNDGRDDSQKQVMVHVDGDAAYTDEQAPQTSITVGSTLENVMQGESVIFPITVQNNAKTDIAYTISVAGATDWADVSISPTTTQIVKSGESQAFYLRIGVKKDAAVGTHVFTAAVSAGTTQVEQLALTANVTQAKSSIWATIGKVLGVALIAFIVVLVVIGVIVAYQRSKDEDGTEPQTYY
ncbi:MAG TPA: hypothetical protein VLJ21_02085 [Candidatus Binatia bacterium]|nr:hypothetical protein [Candidatus Binatia bacterium]